METFSDIFMMHLAQDLPVFLKVCGLIAVSVFAAFKYAVKRGY